MRNTAALFFVLIFSFSVFSQTEAKERVFLPTKLFKERIIKQDFPDVPQEIKEFHARGSITVHISVDEKGKAEKVNVISGFSEEQITDYLTKTITEWKFKPLEIDGRKVPFKGILQTPFCYGSFSNWCVY